jgi:hypothetical protein
MEEHVNLLMEMLDINVCAPLVLAVQDVKIVCILHAFVDSLTDNH